MLSTILEKLLALLEYFMNIDDYIESCFEKYKEK
jgi:hypothetical protein